LDLFVVCFFGRLFVCCLVCSFACLLACLLQVCFVVLFVYLCSSLSQIAEKSEDHPDVVAPFLGYAPSGTVEGDLVYVNYGRIEDFQQLVDKLKITVTGKIAIMRYGKIYRGDKVLKS